jgi:hypothetical protein
MFVQFPHPGPEHDASGLDHMAWSLRGTPHARKFLKAQGTYITGGQVVDGPMAFWGEWEPPSRIIHAFAAGGNRRPRWLHEPYLQRPAPGSAHNTDPLVFGEHFTYSNCHPRTNQKLRNLPEGSVILFGSTMKMNGEWEFVLDTVVVTGEGTEPYTTGSSASLDCQQVVQDVVLGPMRSDPGCQDTKFTLYRGRTYPEAPDGPYSFVPCTPCNDVEGCGFARPAIRLSEQWLRPPLAMSARCVPAIGDQLHGLWQEVARQVGEAGLSLGIRMEAPKIALPLTAAETAPTTPASSRSC